MCINPTQGARNLAQQLHGNTGGTVYQRENVAQNVQIVAPPKTGRQYLNQAGDMIGDYANRVRGYVNSGVKCGEELTLRVLEAALIQSAKMPGSSVTVFYLNGGTYTLDEHTIQSVLRNVPIWRVDIVSNDGSIFVFYINQPTVHECFKAPNTVPPSKWFQADRDRLGSESFYASVADALPYVHPGNETFKASALLSSGGEAWRTYFRGLPILIVCKSAGGSIQTLVCIRLEKRRFVWFGLSGITLSSVAADNKSKDDIGIRLKNPTTEWFMFGRITELPYIEEPGLCGASSGGPATGTPIPQSPPVPAPAPTQPGQLDLQKARETLKSTPGPKSPVPRVRSADLQRAKSKLQPAGKPASAKKND